MPTIARGHKQVNLTFPADLIDAAKVAAAANGRSLTFEIERFLHRLAGRKVPKSPRKRGRRPQAKKTGKRT